ncbi:growth-regulating factor 2-like [Salvia miltiorrhiza]|uniref:growth-regulating factor 2-like n=1 Tax=Salvia miltiorrhiza TaxID=226208 RepID=UPI0025ABC210|nr:growth-regulating factor 2-like [Salvia miltiorrhiza]
MDFALLASDTNLLQNANADADKQKCYGFGFLKQDRAINEEDFREFKMAKTSSCGEGALRYPPHRSNGCSLSSPQAHHQMLSFSSPNSQPYYHYSSNAFARINAGINGGMQQQGVRGPFTPSQWMELEHQALIYKYITANVPIPSYLLNPIRKAFEAAGFSALRSNPLGWGGFHLGFSNTDPEPGRCRRTDGKKWRCSRDAVVDQKYCERHMNRGRHRSRKPVEGQSGHAAATKSVVELSKIKPKDGGVREWERHEFGLVCSDSLVNPLNKKAVRQFMEPESRDTQLSISISTSTSATSTSNWVPISWEPTSMGGPLGEALHSNVQLNLMDRWDSSPRLDSSPTGVLQRGPFASLSNSSAAGSPPHDPSLPPL